MSLKAQIAAGVMTAFSALGDVVRNLTYVSVQSQPTIDVDAGEAAEVTTEYRVPMAVFCRMRVDELGDDVAAQQDQKIIFPMVYLPAGFEKPGNADYILDRRGRRWEIKRYLGEPSETAFIAQVRD